MSVDVGPYTPPQRGSANLSAAPLREWIIDRLREHGLWDEQRKRVYSSTHRDPSLPSFGTLARSWGVSARRLQDVIAGRDVEVTINLADRVFCGAGDPCLLNDLYGKELDLLWPPDAAETAWELAA